MNVQTDLSQDFKEGNIDEASGLLPDLVNSFIVDIVTINHTKDQVLTTIKVGTYSNVV